MKKFKDLLARGKPQQDNFYSLHDASLCENSNYNITPKNRFKYFKFDSYCYEANEPECRISFGSRPDFKELEDSLQCSLSGPEVVAIPLTELNCHFENKFKLEKSEDTSTGYVTSLCETFSQTEKEERKCQAKGKSKSRKNMYMINISNSKCFHIGSQKTVNFIEQECYEQQAGIDDKIPHLKLKLNELLDCEEKMSEECIMLISVHLDNRWKEFIKYLGLEETLFEELQTRNENNRILTVYDALQKFMNMFPDTSFGFVINILCQISQVSVIEKLIKAITAESK